MKATHCIFPFMPYSRDISTDKQADGEPKHCCTKCMVVGIRSQCSSPPYGIQSQSTRKSGGPGRYGALTRDEAIEASYRIYVMTLLRMNFNKEPTIISPCHGRGEEMWKSTVANMSRCTRTRRTASAVAFKVARKLVYSTP